MLISALLNPMDVVKVRLQTQNELVAASVPRRYHGFVHGFRTILNEEGYFRGLMRGLSPSMMRELSYSSLRMGLYDPLKYFFAGETAHPGLLASILAGIVSGAIGSAIATPTDVVKIRFQGELPGQPRRYRNTFHAFYTIYTEEGIRGLYKGVFPTTLRAAILTSSQLASYDHSKRLLLRTGLFQDNPYLHITASIISGLVTTTASSPVDVIKTRWMNARKDAVYKGPFDCFWKSLTAEGPKALFRGWVPNYLRLGPHFLLSLPLYEQIRKLFGLSSL
jgi:solute carrier family 25 protein 14/30